MKTYLFWIKSNRGTNEKAIFRISESWSKEEIETTLENWCSLFGAWTHSDNIIRYGFKAVKVPKRRELLKQWDKICKKRDVVNEKWKTMREMFNIKDTPTGWR